MLFPAGLCILGNTLFTFSSSYACWRLAVGFRVSTAFLCRRDYPVENRAPGEGDRRGGGMIGGMTIANPVGVPGGAWASLQLALYLCAYRGI